MMWVFSLPISHGMHLVIPAHPYFFWVVCHPSRTFLPKEPERKPQNRLSPLPTTKPYPLLPLTLDPPLPVLAGYRLVMFGPCACSILEYVQNLSTAYAFAMVWRLVYALCRSSLTHYGMNYFLIFHSLQLSFFKGWALPNCELSLLELILCSFRYPAATFYHTILLFLSWCYLTRACWAFLGLLLILLLMTQYGY